jgi:hypothetical protein
LPYTIKQEGGVFYIEYTNTRLSYLKTPLGECSCFDAVTYYTSRDKIILLDDENYRLYHTPNIPDMPNMPNMLVILTRSKNPQFVPLQ